MRCTQIFGLPQAAIDFLDKQAKREIQKCPHCQKSIGVGGYKSNIYEDASWCGMFDDGPKLAEYELVDGSIVREVIQDHPWSSGPCIFLKLVDSEGKDLFVWDQETIDNA